MVGSEFLRRLHGLVVLASVLVLAGLLTGCGGPRIELHYPDEALDFSQGTTHIPTLFIDKVTDMRPVEQRMGQGHFFAITYPKDSAWIRPVTEIYGEALAQDLDQTQLVELVPFPGQAEFTLSVDLLSLGSRMTRSPSSLVLTSMVGVGLGLALGDDAAGRTKRAVLFSALATAATASLIGLSLSSLHGSTPFAHSRRW